MSGPTLAPPPTPVPPASSGRPAVPVSTDHLGRLEALAAELTRDQALWMSGYLAALGGGVTTPQEGRTAPGGAVATAQEGRTLPGGGVAAPSGPPATGPEGDATLTILFGSETGNSETVARQLLERAVGAGLPARVLDMATYPVRELRNERLLALVASTHGEGDPPSGAIPFFEYMMGRKAPRLEAARYAVLALGDSSYVEFCKAGRDLDRRLEELGAERILPLATCDVDFKAPAEAWSSALLEVLAVAPAAAAGAVPDGSPWVAVPGAVSAPALSVGAPGVPAEAGADRGASRDAPVMAELLDRHPLTGLGSDKETLHVELRFEPGALRFQPGDALGVVAENEEEVVGAVLTALGAVPDTPVRVGEEELALGDALASRLELTLLTPAFLRRWAEVSGAAELRGLVEGEDREALLRFMRCNQVRDVLESYPLPGVEPQHFVDAVRRAQPRLYSIASAPEWDPGQVDLTVAVVRETLDGKPRNGMASSFLSHRRALGDAIPVFVQENRNFRLPDDPDLPVVMIGAGTGVAPFRAFLQARELAGASGPTWLFFGERRFREDFLYQVEWQRFLEQGVLHRMEVAFSRDQAEKHYVQDRVRACGADLWRWIGEGARIYLCGDARGMARGVDQALEEVARVHGGLDPEGAREWLRGLASGHRYLRDVY